MGHSVSNKLKPTMTMKGLISTKPKYGNVLDIHAFPLWKWLHIIADSYLFILENECENNTYLVKEIAGINIGGIK